MIVTDVNRINPKTGKEVEGFYMSSYLKQNLDGIPAYLKKEWDVVGIVSGHGLVGVGKSTIASQVAYYIAWILAGGDVLVDVNGKVVRTKKPTQEVRFNLKENVVFSAEDLQDRAKTLYEKYGKRQVILYDEGRQGLDSARAMENINKGMQDFFQECRFYSHVIIIVLPNFFKLHEDYAVARSIFLIDAFHDKKFNRGYFNFYNARQKEYLYFFGKKKIGISAKYSATNESFWGRFTKWMPFDKDEYEEAKKIALDKKRLNRNDRRIRLQRDALLYVLREHYNLSLSDLSKYLRESCNIEMTESSIESIISRFRTDDLVSKDYKRAIPLPIIA